MQPATPVGRFIVIGQTLDGNAQGEHYDKFIINNWMIS